MNKDELFLNAYQDVWAAVNLGVSIMHGYVKLTPSEFLVYYCIVRGWQDKLGKDVPEPINSLVKQIEHIAGESLPVLHECYKNAQKVERLTSDLFSDEFNKEPENNDSQQEQPIFIPIKRNKYLS